MTLKSLLPSPIFDFPFAISLPQQKAPARPSGPFNRGGYGRYIPRFGCAVKNYLQQACNTAQIRA